MRSAANSWHDNRVDRRGQVWYQPIRSLSAEGETGLWHRRIFSRQKRVYIAENYCAKCGSIRSTDMKKNNREASIETGQMIAAMRS